MKGRRFGEGEGDFGEEILEQTGNTDGEKEKAEVGVLVVVK